MAMKEYRIGQLLFKTKKYLINHIRKILYSYDLNEFVSKEHFSFLCNLISRHRWADQKIGCGIKSIQIQEAKPWKNRCFFIERIDDTKTDFSFMQCITSPADWHRQDFLKACRATISHQVIDFKKNFFSSPNIKTCSLSGELLSIKDSHVDHEPPNTFRVIVENWLALRNLNINSIEISGYDDNDTEKRFINKETEKDFAEYHSKIASLRVISVKTNLGLPKK